MKIAVTGANGHVGVNLCRKLAESGHQINAFVHRNHEGLSGIPVNIVKGNVLDKASLSPLLDGCDVLFHLAAKISITGGQDGIVSRVNETGTRNILEVAKAMNVKRMIHFSSIHAFSQHPHNQVLDETRPLVNQTGFAYDVSKAAGERAVMEAVKNGFDAVVLSPTAIIGPADHEPSLIGQAVIDLYNRRIPSLVPGGYDWVDVRDVVNGAISAIEKGRTGEKYLLSGHWLSLKDFSLLISTVTGRPTVHTEIPMWVARIGLPFITGYSKLVGIKPLYTSESLTIISEGSRMISHEKASKELNYHSRPLSETIHDFIAWLKQHQIIN